MKIKDAKVKGLHKIKVEVGDRFGVEKRDLFITLREPTTEEILKLTAVEGEFSDEVFGLLTSMIIDHTFDDEDGKRASNEMLMKELVIPMGGIGSRVIQEVTALIPTLKSNEKKPNLLPKLSSGVKGSQKKRTSKDSKSG